MRKTLADLATTVHRERGEALAGERIIAQARIIGPMLVVPGTSTHKMQQVALKKNAFCVLDRPFRLLGQPMRLRPDQT